MYHSRVETNKYGDIKVDVYCYNDYLLKIMFAMQDKGYYMLAIHNIPINYGIYESLGADYQTHIIFVKDIDDRIMRMMKNI